MKDLKLNYLTSVCLFMPAFLLGQPFSIDPSVSLEDSILYSGVDERIKTQITDQLTIQLSRLNIIDSLQGGNIIIDTCGQSVWLKTRDDDGIPFVSNGTLVVQSYRTFWQNSANPTNTSFTTYRNGFQISREEQNPIQGRIFKRDTNWENCQETTELFRDSLLARRTITNRGDTISSEYFPNAPLQVSRESFYFPSIIQQADRFKFTFKVVAKDEPLKLGLRVEGYEEFSLANNDEIFLTPNEEKVIEVTLKLPQTVSSHYGQLYLHFSDHDYPEIRLPIYTERFSAGYASFENEDHFTVSKKEAYLLLPVFGTETHLRLEEENGKSFNYATHAAKSKISLKDLPLGRYTLSMGSCHISGHISFDLVE